MKRILLLIALWCVLNVLPAPPVEHQVNATDSYSHLLGDAGHIPLGPGLKEFSDFPDLILGQFVHSMSHSAIIEMAKPALHYTVTHIVNPSAQEQMGWIHASRNITSMEHLKIFRYLTIVNDPRSPVGRYISAAASIFYAPVIISSGALLGSEPKPAILRFVNESPEPLFKRKGRVTRHAEIARMATVLSRSTPIRNENAPTV